MNLALWIAQSILACVFLFIGGLKVFAYPKYKAITEKNGPSGISRGLATFIGIAELAGAIGVVLPMAVGIVPWLSWWAAIGLAAITLLAVGYHIRRKESPAPPAFLLFLAAFVVWGRFPHGM